MQRRPAGAQAFARLLALAEERDSAQIVRVARFIAAAYNGQVFQIDPFELRAVDLAISDDMLLCLDALRWGRADLHTLVPEGDARVRGDRPVGLALAERHVGDAPHRTESRH